MQKIKKYHLHQNEHFKLHFEVNDAKPYVEKNAKYCFIPYQYSFYQVIGFKTTGQHFIDYETVEHEANSLIFIDKGQIHYFCEDAENQGSLFHFNDFFLHKHNKDTENWLRNYIFNGMGKPLVLPSEEDLEEIRHLTDCIQREVKNKVYNHPRQVYFLFQSILVIIYPLHRIYKTICKFSPSKQIDTLELPNDIPSCYRLIVAPSVQTALLLSKVSGSEGSSENLWLYHNG